MLANGAGMRGARAQEWAKDNLARVGKIERIVADRVFEKTFQAYTHAAKMIATSTTATRDHNGHFTNARGREQKEGKPLHTYVMTEEQWTFLHPAMIELLTDLKFHGGFYLYDRVAKINKLLIENHGNQLAQFKAVATLFGSPPKANELSYMDKYAVAVGLSLGNKETFFGVEAHDIVGAKERRGRIRLSYLIRVIKALEDGKKVVLVTHARSDSRFGGGLNYVSRAAWKANGWKSGCRHDAMTPKTITIHHTAGPKAQTPRSIQEDHQTKSSDPFCDIGYHFLIDAKGAVYQGRPFQDEFNANNAPPSYILPAPKDLKLVLGAHVKKLNNLAGVGVSLIGCFEPAECSDPMVLTKDSLQYQALVNLVAYIATAYDILPSSSTIRPHRHFNSYGHGTTVCPGDNVVKMFDSIVADSKALLGQAGVTPVIGHSQQGEEGEEGPKCITRDGEEGTCISTAGCTGKSIPWAEGDPNPNCWAFPKGIQCCVEHGVEEDNEAVGPRCIARSGQEGKCLSTSECSGIAIPWAHGDPEPNCYTYPKGIQCCIDTENRVQEDDGSAKCITSAGETGTCISISECSGISVPWSRGDREPNCYAYPKGVQCCVQDSSAPTKESKPTVIVEDIPTAPCSLGEDVVVCSSSDRDCTDLFIDSCSVYCQDERSCQEAEIIASTVECVGERSCYDASFRQSDVSCSGQQWYTCRDAEFFASAVTCEDGYYTCDEDMFYPCSCCKSPSPDCYAEPCFDRMTGTAEAFCSSLFLGRSCKAWGNPICNGIAVSSSPPIHSPETCSLGEEVAVCDSADRSCNNFEIDNCSIYCFDACQNAEINSSTVECVGHRSCYGATFRRSDVTCSELQRYTCRDAEFFASAVTCEDGFYTCDEDMFYPCSCCKSPSPDCYAEPCFDRMTGTAEAFCSSLFLGKTCKDWGNPVCETTSVAKLPPLHPSSSCSLGEEVAVCDSNDRSCNNFAIENCSVYCYDACQNAEMSDSTVECVGERSCLGATFRRSDVTCSDRKWYACRDAKFIASTVTCEDGFHTCSNALWDPCSCCDGPDCPPGTPRCSGSGLQDFCSSTFLGKTCKDWGNPSCKT